MKGDALWRTSQDGQSAINSARAHAERIASIAIHFDFARDTENCFFAAAGFPVQLAMTLTERQTRRACTVICRQHEGSWQWIVEGRSPFPACDLIDCVRQRIGARLAGHLTGPVHVGRAN